VSAGADLAKRGTQLSGILLVTLVILMLALVAMWIWLWRRS
jgi:hypothetical protein